MSIRPIAISMRWRVIAAFAAVYLLWGSTYLGIRIAVETIPPFVMAGGRYVLAGSILYIAARSRGAPPPSPSQWRSAAIIGALLLLGNNGLITWAELTVPSSLAALVASTVPLWMILLDWRFGSRVRPTAGMIVGLILGIAGIILLIAPNMRAGPESASPVAMLALVIAALSWAIGSLYSRRTNVPASPLLGTGAQMIMGGVCLLAVSALTGEFGQIHPQLISPRSLWAVVYLIIFGQLVGFTCYVWLLRVSTLARVSTYAFVNPVVALFLGWALGGEELSPFTLVAAIIIVAGVTLMTMFQHKPNTGMKTAALEN